MKILAVDDELVSREKMKKIMENFGQCEAVDNGESALRTFKETFDTDESFDLIMMDVSMPGMDGTEVVYEIRNFENERKILKDKQTKVIMVTSHSDKDTIITCVQAGCNDYIAKPFNRDLVVKKLNRICLNGEKPTDPGKVFAREIVGIAVNNLKKNNIGLPVPSKVIKIINRAVKESFVNGEDLVLNVECDAVISIRLIAYAKSISVGDSKQINTVKQAVDYLGIKKSELLVSDILKDIFDPVIKDIDTMLERLWLHSLACAHCAQAISRALGRQDDDKIYFIGLVHDLGKLLLIHSLNSMINENSIVDWADLADTVNDVHAGFGEAILRNLGLDKDFYNASRYHEKPAPHYEKESITMIISLANIMAQDMGYRCSRGDDMKHSLLNTSRLLKLNESTVLEIKDEVQAKMSNPVKIFF